MGPFPLDTVIDSLIHNGGGLLNYLEILARIKLRTPLRQIIRDLGKALPALSVFNRYLTYNYRVLVHVHL
jgi:hypothetical protein